MKRFLTKLTLFSVLILASYLPLMYLLLNTFPGRMHVPILALKHERLRTLKGPKLILIGGSGVGIGLNGAEMEKAMKLPVVNMSFPAGIGLRFMLDQVRHYIRQGDQVLIIPEYEQFMDMFNGNATLPMLLFFYPEGRKYVTSIKQIERFPESGGQMLIDYFVENTRSLSGRPTRAGSRVPARAERASNHGDVELSSYNQRDYERIKSMSFPLNLREAERKFLPFGDRQEATDYLNEFHGFAVNQKAHVYFAFPCIPDREYEINKQKIIELYHFLQRELKFKIIDSPKDSIYPLEHFFNSIYHLDLQSREKRTQLMIAALKANM